MKRKAVVGLTTLGLVLGAGTALAEGAYTPGTYTAEAMGMGKVVVTVTVDESSITDVELNLDEETAGIGQAAGETLKASVLEAQSADIDTVTGASITSAAVASAVADCLEQAAGGESAAEEAASEGEESVAEEAAQEGEAASEAEASGLLAPGTYEVEEYGFFMGVSDKLLVTVSDTGIESIEWNPDLESGDTPPMRAVVADTLFPRIISYQSVAVDGVTGATATSGAVKQAVTEALKQALAAAGSDESAISQFQEIPEKVGGEETIDTDVLVVGMGGSGTYTALRAAECGAKVLAIEKQGRYGGTTALTSEIESINPPRIMEEYNDGEEYTDAEAMKEAWIEYVEGDEKEDILDLFFEQSGPALDWLALDHGIQFDFEAKPGFTPADWYEVKFQWYPNTNPDFPGMFGANKTEIAANFDSLIDDYTKLGGEYMLETTAYELLTDEDGRVTGVKARNNIDGTEYTINAKAVVLATGGFLGSGEMTEKYLSDEYYPLKGTWNVYGSRGNDGTMIQAAIDNGAATYNIGMPPEVHMSGSAQVIPPSAGFAINEVEGAKGSFSGVQLVWSVADLPTYLGISTNSLAVAQNGKRFASETGIAMLDPWIAGPNYYSIWSTEQLDDIRDNGFKYNMDGVAAGFLGYCGAIPSETPLPETYDVLDKAIEMGFVFKADTIEELAEQIDIDPAALKETVDQYNAFSASGVDEEFGKDGALLEKIGEGPYYAIKMASYSYNTVAGLDIDKEFHVLDAHGEVMNGLYAVGSDSAGVLFSEKKPYVTYGGANNGWALTSGFVAGEIVADYVNS